MAGIALSLPEELIVVEILSRLPVKSLLRFRAVSRRWDSQITSPNFIKLQLDRSIASNQQSLIVHSREDDFNSDNSIRLHYLNSPENGIDLNFPHFPDSEALSLVLVGSCNGIVCVARGFMCYPDFTFLWNPATKLSHLLPDYVHENDEMPDDMDDLYFGTVFGFDPIADDYKVVELKSILGKGCVSAGVYSANGDCWKDIKFNMQFWAGYTSSACVKGVLYWTSENHIVAFDLNKEVFKKFEWPRLRNKCSGQRIMEFRGSIGMLAYKWIEGEYKELSLWSMDGEVDDEQYSWTKMWDFDTFPRVKRIIGFLKSGVTLAETNKEELISYDPKNKETVAIPLSILGNLIDFLTNYTESLVSIRGFKLVSSMKKEDDDTRAN